MTMQFEDLLRQRRSIRSYTDEGVDLDIMEAICRQARKAPSGANLQPGKFHVLTGSALQSLVNRLHKAVDDKKPLDEEYSYFPDTMTPELKARQRNAGYALYESLGIVRRDVAGRRKQFNRNYAFFDAPVGVVVSIDRDMGKGCFMDLGMAIMTFLLSVEDKGLGSTGIGALANYGRIVHRHLGLKKNHLVVCGIAVGHPNKEDPINQFQTERAGLDEYASFHGFNPDGPSDAES